jgi:ketosteroid isomerase-like protein
MTSDIFGRTLAFIFTGTVLWSCSNHNSNKMTEASTRDIVKDIKSKHEKLTEYSEKAQLDSFLSYYDNSPAFLHFSSDGKMRNYEAFKKICTEYYNSLEYQEISTITEKFSVIDTNLAILGWTGNIIAHFKNGDTMKMNNYSISSVFKKIDGKWKIIHSHESAEPPQIIKK